MSFNLAQQLVSAIPNAFNQTLTVRIGAQPHTFTVHGFLPQMVKHSKLMNMLAKQYGDNKESPDCELFKLHLATDMTFRTKSQRHAFRIVWGWVNGVGAANFKTPDRDAHKAYLLACKTYAALPVPPQNDPVGREAHRLAKPSSVPPPIAVLSEKAYDDRFSLLQHARTLIDLFQINEHNWTRALEELSIRSPYRACFLRCDDETSATWTNAYAKRVKLETYIRTHQRICTKPHSPEYARWNCVIDMLLEQCGVLEGGSNCLLPLGIRAKQHLRGQRIPRVTEHFKYQCCQYHEDQTVAKTPAWLARILLWAGEDVFRRAESSFVTVIVMGEHGPITSLVLQIHKYSRVKGGNPGCIALWRQKLDDNNPEDVETQARLKRQCDLANAGWWGTCTVENMEQAIATFVASRPQGLTVRDVGER